MAEECTHNCSSCSQNCASKGNKEESFLVPLNKMSSVKHVVAICSGKGGVGKSLVTSLLAVAMQKKGKNVAILDADITGPSIPKAFGISDEKLSSTEDNLILPARTKSGIQIVSANLLLENETDPIIWRGSLISQAVKQFWGEALWDNVDYMFVDMPPGTGDVPLSVYQFMPVDAVVIVTSPQKLVSMIVEKSINMARKMNKKVLGIVENMSYVKCPKCSEKIEIFGKSDIEDVANNNETQVLAKLPMDMEITKKVDSGEIEDLDIKVLDEAVKELLKL